nr:MAG TPA: hypothetical protein [Caudoviricetes sp.]
MIFKITLIVIVWAVAIAGIIAMKKIQPSNRFYPVWAVSIATLFLIGMWFS